MRRYERGESIRVQSANGVIERVVVEDRGDVVLITRRETYDSAVKLGHEPVSISFDRCWVIEDGEQPR